MHDWFTRLRLGRDEWGSPVYLDEEQLHKSIYVLGRSGMGKSVLLANLAVQFHALGEGVLVVDTKDGRLAQEIAARYDGPDEDIIYVAPGLCFWEGRWHYWGLNVFERRDDMTIPRIISTAISLFERMGSLEAIMTQVEENLEYGIRLTACKKGSTLIDLEKVLTEPAWREDILTTCRVPPNVRDKWDKFDLAYKGPYNQAREMKSTMPRVHRLTLPLEIHNMISQEETTLKIGDWLDAGKLVVCNFGEDIEYPYSVDMGNLIVALTASDGLRRQHVVDEDKKHWRLIVDEFHQLASRQFADLIDLGRSRRVWPVMAHQNKEQLKNYQASNNQLLTSVAGAGVEITLNIGAEDRKYIRDVVGKERAELVEDIEQYQAIVDLPGSPRDSGYPVKVLLDDWWGERDEDRLKRRIDAQKPFTQSKRLIDEDNYKRYYPSPRNGTKNGNATADTEKEPSKPSGAQPEGDTTPAGADRTRDRDAAAARQGPFRHKRPGRDDV